MYERYERFFLNDNLLDKKIKEAENDFNNELKLYRYEIIDIFVCLFQGIISEIYHFYEIFCLCLEKIFIP